MIIMEQNKSVNNAKWLFIIAMGIYVISSTFSLLFYTDGTYTEKGNFLSGAMAILAQVVTYAFPSLGITLMFSYKNKNRGLRYVGRVAGGISFLLGIVLIAYSILASSGFLYIEKENKNKTSYKNSESYTLAQKENIRSTKEYDKANNNIDIKQKKLSELEDNKIKTFKDIDTKYKNKTIKDINDNQNIKALNNDIEKFKALNQYTNEVNPRLKEKNNIIVGIEQSNLKLNESEKKEYNDLIESIKSDIKELKNIKDSEKKNIDISSNSLKSNINNKVIESSYDGYYKSLLPLNVAKQLSSKTLLILSAILEFAPTLLVFVSVVLYEFEPIKWLSGLYPFKFLSGLISFIFNIINWLFELMTIKITSKITRTKLKITESGMTMCATKDINENYNKAMKIYKLNLDKMENKINTLNFDKDKKNKIDESNNEFKKELNKKEESNKNDKSNVKTVRTVLRKKNTNIDTTAQKVYKIMKDEFDKSGKVLSVKKLSEILKLNTNKVQGAREILKENGLIESRPLRGRANKIIIK
jgi:hypothetical protein